VWSFGGNDVREILGGVVLLLVLCAGGLAALWAGWQFRVAKVPGLRVLWGILVVSVLLVCGSAAFAIFHRLYHFARGRRDRSGGIPCTSCARLAFPVEGTTTRYRCSICGCRFDGPEHF
jgi:hypothetical protein